jgi:hypothetical protein
MSSRRLLALGVVLAVLGGLATWRSSSEDASTASVERQSRRASSESSPGAGAGASSAERSATAVASPTVVSVHPSDMTRWPAGQVDAEAFRSAVSVEVERIASARTWLTRLDAESERPSCEGCEPALDAETRARVREALTTYDETLVAVASAELRGEDAVEAYRAAREELLGALPFPGLVWLGTSGFLDTRVEVSALAPTLHRSTRERLPSDGNRFDDPGLQGI